MNLLYTTTGNFQTLETQENIVVWRKKYHIIETLPMEQLTGYLRFDRSSSLALVDAVVCAADTDMIDFGALGPFLSFPIARALKLAEDVRLLPESCAMRDGRKWKSVPFVILYNAANYEMTPGVQQDTHAHLLIQDHSDLALRQIQTIVDEYQDRVLEDIAMWASLSVLKMVVPKSVLHYEEKTHTSKANTITRQRIAGLTRVGSQ